MNVQEFTALLVLAAAMSFSPGPNTTLSTALAANGGLRRAMRFVLAVPVGWSLLLLLTAGGVGALVTAAPALRTMIKALGIAYLLWLAFRLAQLPLPAARPPSEGTRSRPGAARRWLPNRRPDSADQAGLRVGFWQGVGLQFVNIKAWLLALAIVAGWVAGQADPVLRTALVLGVMLLFAFVSNLVYAALGALLRAWLSRGERLLWFNRAMALVLALTALWMGFA